MEEEFLAKDNPCGQALLQLVSRGNAIIAELLRLKDFIPVIFKLETKNDVQKYGEVIQDFSYFATPEIVEKNIEETENLYEISKDIQEYHKETLTRFYNAYDSVYKYVIDLNTFIEDIEDNCFIQQTLDTVFLSEDGVQLMCESVYLYGVMLLVLDIYHPGKIRERLIVSYSRYNLTVTSLDHVCHLMRSTGFINSSVKRPAEYPIDYFNRIKINSKIIEIIIGHLKNEDIYHQQKALPLSQHKTTALAHQSAILFVVLFFSPNTLHNQTARMREIVDKFFCDNWIVNVYMGITVNLIDLWEPFKAAKAALMNTLDINNIKEISNTHSKNLDNLLLETNDILKEGILNKSYLMDNMGKILSLSRECNVTLRWLLLHRAEKHTLVETVKKCKQTKDIFMSSIDHNDHKVLSLLLNTAQFENTVFKLFKTVLDERSNEWDEGKKESLIRIRDLCDIFSGTKHIMRVKKDEGLKNWFENIANQIEGLNLGEPNISARQIAQLIQPLELVQGFQQMTKNLGVKQLASETCELLRNMLNAVNIRDTLFVKMQIIADFSYGWLIVENFTPMIQICIIENPKLVDKLRSLSSAMETALLRINQADNGDLPSVSQYYSEQLVKYIRQLLQVLPREVFLLMSKIAELQTNKVPELPIRLEKEKIKDYAQLSSRFEVAKLTNQMAVFSQGLLNMQETLVGIVKINPRDLLEEGIRKELSSFITEALEQGLSFNPKLKGGDLKTKLESLSKTMEGHKKSFEYIQDYVGINGMKMWQEELDSIILKNVEIECRTLKSKDVQLDVQKSSFIARLCKQLVIVTDPKTTLFSEQEIVWTDLKTKMRLVDLKYFSTIMQAVGVPGMLGLDKLLCFMIVKQLQNLLSFYNKEAKNNKLWMETFGSIAKSLTPETLTIDQPVKIYSTCATRLQKLLTSGILDTIISIGHYQILRKQITYTINQFARVTSRTYSSALTTLNDAILQQAKHNIKDQNHPCPSPEELLKLSNLLEWIGLNDPYNQIYVTTSNIPYLGLLMFVFTTVHIPRFSYDKSLGLLVCKKTNEGITPLTIGLHTLLKQFHSKVTERFVLYSCQYFKSHMLYAISTKPEIPQEATSMMQFLDDFVDYAGIGRSEITKHVPEMILDLFKYGIEGFALN